MRGPDVFLSLSFPLILPLVQVQVYVRVRRRTHGEHALELLSASHTHLPHIRLITHDSGRRLSF